MFIRGKMNESCLSVPFFFGLQFVGQGIDYMEMRMLALQVLELFEVKDILSRPAAEEQPARAVGPPVVERVNDILHRRHPTTTTNTNNLNRWIFVQIKIHVRACESHCV